MYSAGTAKLALTLGGHLGQDVALVGALALEAGTGSGSLIKIQCLDAGRISSGLSRKKVQHSVAGLSGRASER